MIDNTGLDSPDTTLFDLAHDLASIVEAEGVTRHLLVGHAYGNRIVR